MSTFSLRPEVASFRPYSPGLSIDEIKARFGLPVVVKMASNENPLGTSPVAVQALKRAAEQAFRYPRSGNPELAEAIGRHLGVPAARVVTGNGSDEVIDLLLRAVARPGQDNIVAFSPCFSIYETQSRLCGVELRQAPLKDDFSFDFEGLLKLVDAGTAAVFVTNPDNPSGHAVKAGELVALAKRLPERTLFVVDEAYVDFAEPESDYTILPYLSELPRLVVMRTFSKLYGLAGLRVGYGVMHQDLADYFYRIKLPFSVNLLAEAAAKAALSDVSFVQASLEVVREGRKLLARELADMGCQVWPSQANFLMFRPVKPAKDVFEALLAKGVIIRPLGSYGRPDLLRVSIGNAEENALFLQTIREVFGQ